MIAPLQPPGFRPLFYLGEGGEALLPHILAVLQDLVLPGLDHSGLEDTTFSRMRSIRVPVIARGLQVSVCSRDALQHVVFVSASQSRSKLFPRRGPALTSDAS